MCPRYQTCQNLSESHCRAPPQIARVYQGMQIDPVDPEPRDRRPGGSSHHPDRMHSDLSVKKHRGGLAKLVLQPALTLVHLYKVGS
jgi:hypothetical protein